jgi:hypothetical protein
MTSELVKRDQELRRLLAMKADRGEVNEIN